MNADSRTTRWIRLLGLGVALFFAVALAMWFAEQCCRAVSRGTEAFGEWRGYGYPIKEAPGYFEYPNPGGWRIYWLDNERVLYAGHSDQEYEQRSRTRPAFQYYSLRIWNVNSNTVERLDEAQWGHCYFGGYLRYETKRSGEEVVAKEGTIGNLVEVRHPTAYFSAAAQRERDEHQNFFNCRTYRYADLGPEAICLTPLLENDGFLDARGGRCKPNVIERLRQIRESERPVQERMSAEFQVERELGEKPVVYYNSVGSEPIALPIKSKEASLSPGTRYVEWSRQYVVIANETKDQDWHGRWPDRLPRPIYLISRGGAVVRVDLPWTEWNRGRLLDAMPTRQGMLIVDGSEANFYDPGYAGLYLLRDGKLDRALRGVVRTASVAPDGCKVAVGVEFRGPKHFGKLRMIDVCKGGKS